MKRELRKRKPVSYQEPVVPLRGKGGATPKIRLSSAATPRATTGGGKALVNGGSSSVRASSRGKGKENDKAFTGAQKQLLAGDYAAPAAAAGDSVCRKRSAAEASPYSAESLAKRRASNGRPQRPSAPSDAASGDATERKTQLATSEVVQNRYNTCQKEPKWETTPRASGSADAAAVAGDFGANASPLEMEAASPAAVSASVLQVVASRAAAASLQPRMPTNFMSAAQEAFLKELNALLGASEEQERRKNAKGGAGGGGGRGSRSSGKDGGGKNVSSSNGRGAKRAGQSAEEEALYWKQQFERLSELRETEAERLLRQYRSHVDARDEASKALIQHLRSRLAEPGSSDVSVSGVAVAAAAAAVAAPSTGGESLDDAASHSGSKDHATTPVGASGRSNCGGGRNSSGGGDSSNASHDVDVAPQEPSPAIGLPEREDASLGVAAAASAAASSGPGALETDTAASAAPAAAAAAAAVAALEAKVERQREVIRLYQMLSSVAIKPAEVDAAVAERGGGAAGDPISGSGGPPEFVCTAVNHIHKRAVRFSLRVPPSLEPSALSSAKAQNPTAAGGTETEGGEGEDDVAFLPVANAMLLPPYMRAPLSFSAEQSPLFLTKLLQNLFKSEGQV